MQFLLITRYRNGPSPVYARAATEGRMLPEEVRFVGSWIVDSRRLDECYEVVEATRREDLDPWIDRWSDLIDVTVLPVISSAEAAARSGFCWNG